MGGPLSFEYAIRSATRIYLEDCEAGDCVLVGTSGGADSLALAAALFTESESLALNVIAVIVDHGLQENSELVTHSAKETLEKIGYKKIEIIKVIVDVKDGIEASARRVRYEAFDKIAIKYQVKKFFLGHTKNDQAESVLLGLARGSGTRSLSGMADVQGIYHRPLLSITREMTEGACKELGISFWDDPHNHDWQFLRVRVREKVLPELESDIGPGISDALVRSAKLLRDDADALDQLAMDFFTRIDPYSLLVADLEKLPRAIRTRILRLAIYSAGSPQGSLTADHIEPIEALITDWKGQKALSLPGGVKIERISGRLSLSTLGK